MFSSIFQTVGISSEEAKLKLSAIFFDKIYPLDHSIIIPKELIAQNFIDNAQHKSLSEKIQSDFNSKYMKLLTDKILPEYFSDKQSVDRDTVIKILEKTGYEARAKTLNLYAIEAAKIISKDNILAIPVFNETILYDHLEKDYLNNKSVEKVEIKIIDAPTIIASELEWEQIVEAKKDQDFNKKVKRFGVFINKNYKGRDIGYIIDDLSMQIEDYKEACSKHGIGLKNEVYKSLANSKSMFGTLGVTFCSMLMKMPEYAITSGIIGAALELLNLKITVKQYNDKFESFVNESPLSLIFELEKLTKSD